MSLLQSKKLFLFDFDGTLADTSRDILASVNYLRRHYGLPELSFDKAKIYIGIGRTALVQGVIQEGQKDINQEEAVSLFTEHHLQHMFDHVLFYPHVAGTLKALEEKEKSLCIISNKYSYYIKKILEYLHCPVTFDLILGADNSVSRKPSPDPLNLVCRTLEINPAEAVMVGDSKYDVQAGRAAGITTVACSYGFNDLLSLQNEQPDLFINSFEQLLSI